MIVFHAADRDYIYKCEAECCNHVWIEHIDNVEALIGTTVLGVEQSKCTNLESADNMTDKGICRVEVRNNHNGFYAGDVVYVESVVSSIESMKNYVRFLEALNEEVERAVLTDTDFHMPLVGLRPFTKTRRG